MTATRPDFILDIGIISFRSLANQVEVGDIGAQPCSGLGQAILSAPRRSAEEYVTGDWAAVAIAVNQRMTELGRSQREVIRRSDLSKATVREIQKNIEPRDRKVRILEAISVALDWNPGHLAAVLQGRIPPGVDAPSVKSADDIPGRLDVIEHRLDQIVEGLNKVDMTEERLNEFKEDVVTAIRDTIIGMRQPQR